MRDYSDPQYKKLRTLVLKRDKHKCQMPDCKVRRKLHVHHILTWAGHPYLRYDAMNCITLCRECHKKVTGVEYCYAALFSRIVNANSNRH